MTERINDNDRVGKPLHDIENSPIIIRILFLLYTIYHNIRNYFMQLKHI